MNGPHEEILDFYKTLYGDVTRSVEELNQAPDEFDYYARVYIRAFSLWLEGSIWLYKQLLTADERVWRPLPFEYQMYLHGYDWKVGQSGKPQTAEKRLSTQDNLKAFFKTLEEAFSSFSVDLSGQEWKA